MGSGGAGLDCGFDDGSHYDHSGAASVGGVVDGAVFVGGEIAGTLGGERDSILGDGAGDDAVLEGGQHHFREKRDEIDLHCGNLRVPLSNRCVSAFGLRVNLRCERSG